MHVVKVDGARRAGASRSGVRFGLDGCVMRWGRIDRRERMAKERDADPGEGGRGGLGLRGVGGERHAAPRPEAWAGFLALARSHHRHLVECGGVAVVGA